MATEREEELNASHRANKRARDRGEAGLCSTFPVWTPFPHLVTKKKVLSQERKKRATREKKPKYLNNAPASAALPRGLWVSGHVYEELLWLFTDLWGSSPLWVVHSLGRWVLSCIKWPSLGACLLLMWCFIGFFVFELTERATVLPTAKHWACCTKLSILL